MRSKPKKKLGQNFLFDNNIQKKIIEACKISTHDTILEIGAGRGEITKLIADRAGQVYALEIDPDLCDTLRHNLKGVKNVKIINKDILKFNLKSYFKDVHQKIKIIGNIPYYITTPIIDFILKNRAKISHAYITVQREFARRIISVAGSKEYGSLSCYVQYYAQAKIAFLIKKTCFFPQPNVDSSFLELQIRDEPSVLVKKEKLFFKIIRQAFNKRRKILKNSLRGIISNDKLNHFFQKYGIDGNIRPEDLTLQDFANLSNL